MCRRSLVFALLLVLIPYSRLSSQQQAESLSETAPQEFPLTPEKRLTAGKTAVGTRIQAKLAIATLVNGKVIPRNAVFSGAVVQSVARTKTGPSRIGIRMDAVSWKQGFEPINVYLTSWYYPTTPDPGQNLRYGPDQPASRTWDGQGQYPDQNSHVYRPFPGSDSDNAKQSGAPNTSNPVQSNHPVSMKHVELERFSDGTIVLVSIHDNLKIDNRTTYIFANPGGGAPK